MPSLVWKEGEKRSVVEAAESGIVIGGGGGGCAHMLLALSNLTMEHAFLSR